MPKQKTHRGAAKRMSLTGSGKIKFKHTNRRHLLRKRSTKQKRNLTITGTLGQTEIVRSELMLVAGAAKAHRKPNPAPEA